MRCDTCVYFIECDVLKELNHTIEKISIRERLRATAFSLKEDLYVLIPKYCSLYIDE